MRMGDSVVDEVVELDGIFAVLDDCVVTISIIVDFDEDDEMFWKM